MEGSRCAGTQIPGEESSFNYRFAVVIVCDGDESQRRALDHLRRVTSAWMDDFIFEVRIWPLEVFTRDAVAIACNDLAAADLLILAMEDVVRLSEDNRNQLCEAFQQMRVGSAAVATLTKNDDATASACIDSLHAAASQAGIDFIFPAANPMQKRREGNALPPDDVDLRPVDSEHE